MLFDTHPGNSLRVIAGRRSVHNKDALPAAEWSHVAAVIDRISVRLYLNGKQIASAGEMKAGEHRVAVTRGYTLQRWINAYGGRGGCPIKFNGSIFTVNGVFPYRLCGIGKPSSATRFASRTSALARHFSPWSEPVGSAARLLVGNASTERQADRSRSLLYIERERNGPSFHPASPAAKREKTMPGVDFNRLRSEITMEQVLNLLGFEPYA